ncbi:MAG: GTP-binding protein [Planctomycetota bacterium]
MSISEPSPTAAATDGGDAEDRELWAALDAVRGAIEQVERCNPAERDALVAELRELKDLAKKLRSGRVEIVVFGEISTGKSALINALTGASVASVSVRGGWTKDVWRLDWEGAGYCLPGFDQSEVVLVDTPGLNEVGGADRADMARSAAERADLILFVTDSDLNETEHNALSDLAACHKPMLLVVNKTDLYTPQQLEDLKTALLEDRVAGVLDPADVVFTAADPREVQHVIEAADGTTREEWRKPPPRIDDLRARILEVLEADGSSLIALSASMYAADRSDRVAALRVKLRNSKASGVIWTYAVAKAMAVALNPVAVADVAGGAAVDAAMVATLAGVYGIKITTANAGQLVVSIVKAAGWVLAAELAASYGASALKALSLGSVTPLTALPQGAAAGYGSYIVGQAARYYFEQGASWGGRGPKSVVADVLKNTDKQSVIGRLRGEIKAKLRSNRHAGS